MRRLLSVPLAAVACLLASSVALAAPPTHEWVESPPLEFAAGEMCAFPLRDVIIRETSKVTTYPVARDGSQRTVVRGSAANVVTNLATGETFHRTGGYRIVFTVMADGSVVAKGTGSLYAFYVAGDPGDLGPGYHAVHGQVGERYAPDGSFVGASFSGSSINLCEALA